ncbi:MAG: hypothetical protein HQL91_09105 [Magnetococcales bacterium]|nr:hypothetical protein [Magnetococcales bacterium]
MKKPVCRFCPLLTLLILLIPGYKPVLAEEDNGTAPWWDPERYGVQGKYDPWTLSGGVGLRSSRTMLKATDQNNQETQHQYFTQIRAGKGARGFFMEPYIAQWKTDFLGGLTLSQTLQNNQTSESEEAKKVNVAAQSLQSNVDLRVFPESNFPFNLYFNRVNSANGGSAVESVGRLSQKYGVIQQYRDRPSAMNARLQIERRTDSSGDKDGSGLMPMVLPSIRETEDATKANLVNVRIDKQLFDHNLELVGKLANQDGVTLLGKGNTWEKSVVFTHSVSPSEELSINNMSSVSRTRDFKHTFDNEAVTIRQETDGFVTANVRQFTSNAFWRSNESPLMINGSLRVQNEISDDTSTTNAFNTLSPTQLAVLGFSQNDIMLANSGLLPLNNALLTALGLIPSTTRANQGTSYTRTLNSRLGASYRFDEHHSVNGSLTGNNDIREIDTAENFTSSNLTTYIQTVGYQYDHGPIKLDEYDYNWYSSTALSNTMITGFPTLRQTGERLGHSIGRTFGDPKDREGDFKVTLDGSLGMLHAKDLTADVTHSLGIGYQTDQEDARSLIDLRLTDSRSLVGAADESQMVNLQFSRNSTSEGTGGLSGNLTFNWMRHLAEDGLQTYTQSSSGSLRYSVSDLMGVPKLRYDMLTTITASTLTLFAFTPVQQEISWRNQLTYTIGQLNLRLGGELKYLQDQEGLKSYQALLTLEVVRNFYRRFGE